MSESLVDLMNDLHQMHILLDFMMKGFAALSTESVDKNLRLTEFEAYQVAEYGRNMVDQKSRGSIQKRILQALRSLMGVGVGASVSNFNDLSEIIYCLFWTRFVRAIER